MRVRSIVTSNPIQKPRLLAALAGSMCIAVFLLPMAVAEPAGAQAPERWTADGGKELVQVQPTAQVGARLELANPVAGSIVTAPYGPMRDPFTNKERHHAGIDLASPTGTPVRAPAAGVVELATSEWEQNPAAGTVVILDHGHGVKTFYAHLQTTAVVAGQQLQRGEVLGTVGSTGKSTGPHLHLEVWEDGAPVPPSRYVSEWRGGPHPKD